MTEPKSDFSIINSRDLLCDLHRFCHDAMATTFEVIIADSKTDYAEQAAHAAFNELDRLEAELSRFIENSDISRINNLPAGQSLQIGPAVFECLQLGEQMFRQTGGAFDVTAGASRSRYELNESEHTIQMLADSVQLDLGGIGKGFAVDKMAELLRQWSINCALIHGGYSSVLALDAAAGTKGWQVTLSNPVNRKQTLASLDLKNRALGSSGLQKGRHIIDPHTAKPVENTLAAWACSATAAEADALSTAFMVMSPQQIKQYCINNPDTQALIVINRRKERIFRLGL
jgi:thiamine biosynthesis lipoprotein